MGAWNARQIWRELPRERRMQVALALWEDERLLREQRQVALSGWLSARGMRPAFLEKLPRTRRADLMAGGGLTEDAASQALMSYHLTHRRELLARFLDALGVAHEDGLIQEEFEPPDGEAVEAAVEALRRDFPEGDVDLYLKTLTAMDPLAWAAVAERLPDPQ
jgi:hypothetical protein